MFRTACQFCSLKRFPEAASQTCSPKYLCKAVAPDLLCFKSVSQSVPQSYSPKRLPKAAPQSCVLKLLPRGDPHSAAVQSCSGSPKLVSKPAPQTCSPKPFPKLVIESCSEQLLSLPPKIVSKSGFPNFHFPKLSFFKETIRQCYCKIEKCSCNCHLVYQLQNLLKSTTEDTSIRWGNTS